MKSLKILLALVLLVAVTTGLNAQFRKTVYGNGKVVTKERQAGSFNGLKVSSGVDVFLKQGDQESITVEADDNIQEYIRTEISNGVLSVWTEADIRKAERERVYVTMKDVRSIKTTSAGDVTAQTPIKTDRLELSATSAGDIKMEVYADEIELDITSSGDMTLSGETTRLDASLSSAGDLNAFQLKVKEAEVSASSAGDADVYVTERLTARASSAGDINYSGNPKYLNAHSSSAGGIHKK